MATLNKLPRYVAAVVFLLTIVSAAQAQYSGGTGDPNDPYQIATAADLIALGEDPNDYDKHFILTSDIDLDPSLPGRKIFDKAVIAPDTNDATTWFDGIAFTGMFDGNGHTISKLTIAGAGYLGLFGQLGSWLHQAEVRDLTLLDASIIGSGDYIGGLVGTNVGNVARCHSNGTVTGTGDSIGGLVGQNGLWGRRGGSGSVGRITESYSNASVSGRNVVGGLVGANISGSISDCYSSGAVDGNDVVGGLVGSNGDLVTDCYSTGPVIGAGSVGGLVGENWDLVNCSFWDIETSGQDSSAGGTGKPTTEMQTTGNFLTWAACGPIWTIDEGKDYPRLAWENAQGQTIFVQSYGGGTGTAEDPYLIYTAEELNTIGLILCHANKHFKLMADVDMSDFDGKDGRPNFNMIGPGQWYYSEWSSHFEGVAFDGVFDGNGHTISRLTVTGDGNLGMFGYLSSESEIMDLTVVDVNVTGSGSNVGGLAGYNDGYLIRCSSTGIVSGGSSVGGLVGDNGGIMTGCFSTVTATAQGDYAGSVGGLAGNNDGAIAECYSTGAVSGQSAIGGLVGNNSGNITTSYSTGAAGGQSAIGGLVGSNYGGTVTRCYSNGAVSGDSSVGGLVGSGSSPQGVMHSAWDVETSGVSASAGGVGLETAEMMDPHMLGLNGFANDPNWVLDVGRDYPRLALEGSPGQIIPEPKVDWLEGSGTPETPYRIDTAGQLVFLPRASLLWDRHFILGADIDLDPRLSDREIFGQAVIPVFSGVFDGDGHTISHLTIEGGDYLGLFGCVSDPNSEIRNVGLIDPSVRGGRYLGALVGSLENGTVADCIVKTGRVSGSNTVGGLVGSGSNIIGCLVQDVEVLAGDTFIGNAGGLVGSGGHGIVADCHVVGGLVRASGQVGGLAGSTGGATIYRCSASANVEAGADQNVWVLLCTAGGLVGSNGGSFAGSGGTIESCCATGNVSQSGAISDFLGDLFPSGVGGLVGINSGAVRQSYATGAVTATVSAGGLVGAGWGSVTQCYSSGTVNGSGKHAGGLVGDGYPTKVTYSLWNVETSGLSMSAGGVGLTTVEMMDPYMPALNGFANDPNWVMDAGRDYPRLAWEGTPGNIIPEANIDWLAGEGTADSPYRIDTADQMILLSKTCILWNRNFVLGADIDLDPAQPERPIFRQAVIQEFTGVFDGADHVISNLTIDGGQNLGFFGSLTAEAQLRNIRLVHVNVAGLGIYTGGLVGENKGNVVACYSSGSVSGTYDVGGLVGSNEGSIATSSSTGTVSGTDSSVGGLTGRNYGTIDSSYCSSTVSGTGQVGGLVGSNSGSVANSYSNGSVSGTSGAGGLTGVNYNGLITYSYSTASVSGTNYVGGFAGNSNQSNISLSFWDVQTSGQTTSAGGIGKTTAEMQTASTFLEAGWDFVGETANGTRDIWWILEGQDYPRLWWETAGE